ncbi:serine carboxypeptidase [Mycena albidolilacea]|uniref:Carboxypeptidase n=1 Tax=Mycena albidolilacea TaxID=1033008 RepID=A0AAD6ZAN8_9AGAR|nr:serine carboxypeptidase [Mycena albidolilacea]
MRFIHFLRPFTVLPAVFGLRVSMDDQQVFSGMEREAMTYEHVSHPSFSDYSLRLKTPTLCDDSVKQYSGYLDIAEDKHLFFWFFESRSSPASDPLVLWLNGGAGCSSMTGLLFELGPCNINKTEGGTVFTSHNPHAWNNNANVIFLDQPVMTGYSFSSNKTAHVKTTPEAARDVYAFLQLFFRRFEEYATQPFHIAAESYGGHFAPHIASIVHHKNKQLVHAPSADLRKINLASIMLGNALTDPLIQMPSVVEYACDSPLAVFSPKSPQCRSLRIRGRICERMIGACYALDTRAVCAPATFYCWSMWTVLAEAKRNFHDIRMPCETNPDCYSELNWMTEYMNRPDVRTALGVDPRAPKFVDCNMDMLVEFMAQGDGMRNTKSVVPELVHEGIRLLVYAGNADMACNYMGNSRWVAELPSIHKDAFGDAPFRPWIVSGRQAGVVRSAGDGAGNVTYLTVFEAGHMVPHDQPEAALDMLNRWICNTPLAD